MHKFRSNWRMAQQQIEDFERRNFEFETNMKHMDITLKQKNDQISENFQKIEEYNNLEK